MKERRFFVSNSSSSSCVPPMNFQMLKELLDAGQISKRDFNKSVKIYRKAHHSMKHKKWRGLKEMTQPNWYTGMTSLYNLKYAIFGKPYEELKRSYVNMVWKTQKGVGYAMPLFKEYNTVTLLQVERLMEGKTDAELKAMFVKRIWSEDDMRQAVNAFEKEKDVSAKSFMSQYEFTDTLKFAVRFFEEEDEVKKSMYDNVASIYQRWCWEHDE